MADYLTVCDDCEHVLLDEEEETAYLVAESHRQRRDHEPVVLETDDAESACETVKRLYGDGIAVGYQLLDRGGESHKVCVKADFGGAT